MHQSYSTDRGTTHQRQLLIVLALSVVTTIAEVVGSYLTGSLALLADAGHVLTDVAGVIMSLIAMRLAGRPATDQKTFGYYRAEILAALANSLLLIAIAGYVVYEAYRRFGSPSDVLGGWMMAIAVVGLVANVISALLLRGSATESLNVRGAYLDVLGDALGSVGVIVAGLVVLITGWQAADPIIGVGIGLFILPRAWSLLSESMEILLESTPRDLDLSAVRAELKLLSGVVEVHDLHAWSITKGMNAMSGHLVVDDSSNASSTLAAAKTLLCGQFGLAHSTLQIEPRGFREPRDDDRFASEVPAVHTDSDDAH